jgi:mitochondrial fission protein ELM1
VVDNKAAVLATSAAGTFPLTVLLPHEALRRTRIVHPTIAQLKIARRKGDHKTHVPRRDARKRAVPKTHALSKIVVLSAISLIIRRCLTFTTMTPGSAMILAAEMNTITWIIHGNTAASLAALAAAMSTALAEEIATASGSTIFISASRRTTTIMSMIGTGATTPS